MALTAGLDLKAMLRQSPSRGNLLLLTLLVVTTSATLTSADEVVLKVGDPAPQFQTGKWIRGEPVKNFQKGTAYLIVFWSTSNDSSIRSIPRLNRIQLQYKDKHLVVIGQNCSEQDDNAVTRFVDSKGAEMAYRVALEDKGGKMVESWLLAAGHKGIPNAFLINTNSEIAWMGHPALLFDETIEDALAGKIDLRMTEQTATAEQAISQLGTEVSQALRGTNWDEALAKMDKIANVLPKDQRDRLDVVRFRVLLTEKKDYKAAYRFVAQLSEQRKDDGKLQNDWAWYIATGKDVEQRDLAVAEMMAKRANAATKGQSPEVLDTLARVLFMQGKKDEAIAIQEKAVSFAEGEKKVKLEKVLDSYRNGHLPSAE